MNIIILFWYCIWFLFVRCYVECKMIVQFGFGRIFIYLDDHIVRCFQQYEVRQRLPCVPQDIFGHSSYVIDILVFVFRVLSAEYTQHLCYDFLLSRCFILIFVFNFSFQIFAISSHETLITYHSLLNALANLVNLPSVILFHVLYIKLTKFYYLIRIKHSFRCIDFFFYVSVF